MRWSGYSTFAAVAIVAYGSVSSRAQTTRPAGPSYSLQDVVTAVTAAESLLPELRLDYTQDWFRPDESQPGSKRRLRTTETFARKQPEGWVYHEITGEFYDPNSGRTWPEPRSDIRVRFDGQTTSRLETRPNAYGQRTAIVFPGKRDPYVQDAIERCFHFSLWRASAVMSYADVFKEGNCRVTNADEVIEGVRTVRVDCDQPQYRAVLRVWFAPERSWLALKRQYTANLPDGRVLARQQELSELARLENGVWYPRLVRTGMLDDADRHAIIRVTRVSTAPLPHASFRQQFPLNTRVTDQASGQTYVEGVWLLWSGGAVFVFALGLIFWLAGHPLRWRKRTRSGI